MITKDNLRDVLIALDFDHNKTADVYYRAFIGKKCEIRVDFKNQSISYPENEGFKVNDRTTCNFDHPENFVVLECVCRLLEKGYHSEHIELEKRWNLGHDAKGGKADICVYNKDGKDMLLIIECKTFGSEHNKALKQLKEDGGQLFSYWQQERSTQWLSLYASDFQNGKVVYENKIIHCVDDDEVRKLAKKDKSQKLYDNARTVQDLFEVWDETYDKRILNKGVIFGEESSAYQIGIPPLRKKHLVDFRPEDKIVNRFEEILRHNNVSDKENAFNRLIALFICKLVDEIQKNDEDVVEFQYKMGETYESLQDRLQRLHQEGMEKFMREEIYYIPDDYAEKLFANRLNSKNRKAAIEDLQNTIRILKFYSNNDFAFKDVHNEQLFYQNGKVLVEVVELFQGYRIVYPSKQQFLGDLFEQLLNKGFKQNEGQFFTPMPITRFIWDCLPLEKIIDSKSGFKFPKVIDYACGAGHFLTEGIEAINEFFQYHGKAKRIDNNAWVEHSIFGVEKDYRLARVAKVSLYMNGAGLGNIKFGDGLESYPEEGIKDTSFDILVANPPYSVNGFKMHLKVKEDAFELLKRNLISNDAGEIETLFVERISQLLKPCGIAAVILPSSILSNESGSYIGAREILLQNFYLRGVTLFGGKTFGATNTNTVVLFLEKYDEPPQKKEIIKDSIEAILSGKIEDDWNDKEIFKAYLEKINVEEDLYKSFASETISVDELKSNEYFAQYVEWLKKDKSQKKKSDQRKLLKIIKEKEWEKLFYFSLIYNQKTVVISAPTDNNEQKKFLGYDWSNRKGAEGIQINQPGGKLFNDCNRYADNTLAAALRSSFSETNILLSEDLENYYAVLRTQDMIDFNRVSFNKLFNVSVNKKIKFSSKYSLVKLSSISEISSGNSAPQKDEFYSNGKYPFFRVSDVAKDHLNDNLIESADNLNDKGIKGMRLFKKGTILFPKSGASTYLDHRAIMGVDGYVVSHLATICINTKKAIVKFVYEILTNIKARNIKPDSGYPSLNSSDLENILIPLPPLSVQQQIISECEKIDSLQSSAQKDIIKYQDNISNIIESVEGVKTKLADIVDLKNGLNYTKSDSGEIIRIIGVKDFQDNFSPNIAELERVQIEGKISDDYLLQNGDILIVRSNGSKNLVGRCIFISDLDVEHTSFSGFTIRIRVASDTILPKFLCHCLRSKTVRTRMMTDSKGSNINNISQSILSNLKISIPPLFEQKQIVSKIEQYEEQIAQAKAIMAECPTKKKAILKKYLE